MRACALSLFVSQMASVDDTRCLEAATRVQSARMSAFVALHRWLLSIALLHIRLRGGLMLSTAVHALVGSTAVVTRMFTLTL